MGGPGSGPKVAVGQRADKTRIKMGRLIDYATPKLVESLIAKGISGDVQAATYLLDRRHGKPVAAIALEANISYEPLPTDYARLARLALQEQALLLSGPDTDGDTSLNTPSYPTSHKEEGDDKANDGANEGVSEEEEGCKA